MRSRQKSDELKIEEPVRRDESAPFPMPERWTDYNRRGVAVALTVIAAWLATEYVLLFCLPLGWRTSWSALLGAGLATFLFTGLFITAHDAMHGLVAPKSPSLNRAIGIVSVTLYALFSYDKLLAQHKRHHGGPASHDDPDFHDGKRRSPVAWYLTFMFRYVSWRQLVGMAIVSNVLIHAFGTPVLNVLLLWALPAILSTIQLFYFGTYLPHREESNGYDDHHRARSNAYPVWLSFLTCYHFGYHWEHHQFPYVPWWRLPEARRLHAESRQIAG